MVQESRADWRVVKWRRKKRRKRKRKFVRKKCELMWFMKIVLQPVLAPFVSSRAKWNCEAENKFFFLSFFWKKCPNALLHYALLKVIKHWLPWPKQQQLNQFYPEAHQEEEEVFFLPCLTFPASTTDVTSLSDKDKSEETLASFLPCLIFASSSDWPQVRTSNWQINKAKEKKEEGRFLKLALESEREKICKEREERERERKAGLVRMCG